MHTLMLFKLRVLREASLASSFLMLPSTSVLFGGSSPRGLSSAAIATAEKPPSILDVEKVKYDIKLDAWRTNHYLSDN